MSDISAQWLWFFDDQLVHALLAVDPDHPQLARRAAAHPAVVNGTKLWLGRMPEEALQELGTAIAHGDPDGMALAAQIHYELGQVDRACQLYGKLAALFPGHPHASFNLGLCRARLREWAGAVESLQRAVVLDPDRAEAWFTLGVCLVNERRAAEARAAFARSLKLRGDYAPAWLGQAVCLQLEGNPGEALAIYERLLESQPGREELLTNALGAAASQMDAAKVRSLATRLLQLRPNAVPAHLALAWIAIDQEDFDEAARRCALVAEAGPAAFEHWYNLGVCSSRIRQPERAAAAFEKALRLRADDPDATEGLARSLADLGRTQEAKTAWRRLLETAPQHVSAWFSLGVLLASSGEPAEAAAAFEQSARRKPDWLDAWVNLGNARWAAGDTTGAVAAFQNVLESSPFHAGARRAMAALAVERRDAAAAERYLEGLSSKDWEILYNLALLLHADGKLDRAASLYREVLAARPDFAEARFNLGSVLFGLGRIEESQASWKAAVSQSPDLAAQLLNWVGTGPVGTSNSSGG